eukprot:4438361-Alexandrium_andersonii.AAC.1
MLRLLGAQQRDWVVLDAERPFARERTFLCTLLPGPSAERRWRRDLGPVSEEGWHRKSADRMPTVMTACRAEGEPLRFSAYQYKP